jgi:hypothetical protein
MMTAFLARSICEPRTNNRVFQIVYTGDCGNITSKVCLCKRIALAYVQQKAGCGIKTYSTFLVVNGFFR